MNLFFEKSHIHFQYNFKSTSVKLFTFLFKNILGALYVHLLS